MKKFKVLLHCLLKTWANIRGEDHRAVVYYCSYYDKSGLVNITEHFCSCGYKRNPQLYSKVLDD